MSSSQISFSPFGKRVPTPKTTPKTTAAKKYVAKTYQEAISRHFYRIAARLWLNFKTRAASLKELYEHKYIPIFCWNYVTFNEEFLQQQEAMQYYQIYVRPELKFTTKMRDKYERVLWKQNYICFISKKHENIMDELCEKTGINDDVRGIIESFLWHSQIS
jgi:hypothetical protein